MNKLTLGSLFDGSGGFPLGGLLSGITPVWASEIEPFPIRVTTKRLPFMKHYGDVSRMDGGKIEPVDIITFGSPCQDMSIAGRREGLDGSRSSLFYEAVRIVKEMRCATDGRYPRYIVWENVPGAFSSNKGADFQSVLEEICSVKGYEVDPARPERWANAGEIVADDFSLAWRVFDAQYWGVPQRRKRIYLVADFAGGSAGKILFESEGVWRHYQESREQRKKTAADLGGGTLTSDTGADIVCLMDQGGQRMDVYRNLIGTLLAHSSSTPPIIMASSQANAEIGIGYCPTITAAAGMAGNNQPILFDNHGPDTRYSGPVKVAQTITSALGTGGNNTPLAVHGEPYCIAGNVINRQDKNGGNGCGYQQGVSYTLTTEDRHCVAYTDDLPELYQDVVGTLCAKDAKGLNSQYVSQSKCIVSRKKRVRKLIPLECERLMGFPDYWTDIPGASDSVRYRALGNSVAVPCVEYILCGIAYFLERQEGERDVHIPG